MTARGTSDDPLLTFVRDGEITSMLRSEALQLVFEQLNANHHGSMVDELIAERRAEAARDAASN